MDVYNNRLTLKSISPMRVNIIQSYKEKQKTYMQYLEVKACLKKGLLKMAYEAYQNFTKSDSLSGTLNDGTKRSKKSKFIILKNDKLKRKKTSKL